MARKLITPSDILQDPQVALLAQDIREQFQRVKDSLTGLSVNVKSFGAKVDGVTDDADAFEEGLLYAIENDLELAIPAGTMYTTRAPGVIPPDPATNQVDVPAIIDPINKVRIRGAGKGVTEILVKAAPRSTELTGVTSWPFVRVMGGPGFEIRDLTINGGVPTRPDPGALTLTGDYDSRLRAVNTIVETDETVDVVIENVEIKEYYLHRPGVSWAADISNSPSRRTGGIAIHRASKVRVRNLTVGTRSYREGPFFMNCQNVDIDGYNFEGDVAVQDAATSHAMSTPLNIYGPEARYIRISNFRIWNNGGSAMNLGGRGNIRISDGLIGGTPDSGYGDGMDLGQEHQEQFNPAHPTLSDVSISNVNFEGCSRYSLRCYKSRTVRASNFTIDNLKFVRCYQGPEFGNVDNLKMTNISVVDCFYREDYSTSGRGIYIGKCDGVTWDNVSVEAPGGDGVTDYMTIGINIEYCSNVRGGLARISEMLNAHFLIYQSTADGAAGDYPSNIHIGDLYCLQTQTRDPTSLWTPIHLGRSGNGRVQGLTVGDVRYNSLSAIETPGIMTVHSTELVYGLERDVRGSPLNAQVYNTVLHQLDIVNGDGSSPNGAVRAGIEWRVGNSNGRGATGHVKTATNGETASDSIVFPEHGGLVVLPTRATATALTRTRGEFYVDSSGVPYFCSASGTIYTGGALSGVTATADGTTTVIIAGTDVARVVPSVYITIDGVLHRVAAVDGTTVTTFDNVAAGTGVAVAWAEPTLNQLAFV